MDRYKVIFNKKAGGSEYKSWGYYTGEDDFNDRNSTYIFVKMTGDKEKFKKLEPEDE